MRQYELDVNGHVNNAVYLNYAEELAVQHAARSGFGPEWTAAHDGAWFIRRNEITYYAPARYGDELELTVRLELVRGARGHRRTTIRRVGDGALIAVVFTEWVWTRRSDGKPAPVPQELVELAASAARVARQAARRPPN